MQVPDHLLNPTFSPQLWIQRRSLANTILTDFKSNSIIDLGTGEGALIDILLNCPQFSTINAIDSDLLCVEKTYNLIKFKSSKPACKSCVNLFHGNLALQDSRFVGFDALVCLEVIEHLQPIELAQFPETIFGFNKPKIAIISTPNAEFNLHFPDLQYNTIKKFRHFDHKFEWTRLEFKNWCENIATVYGYYLFFTGCGRVAETFDLLGYCTQMCLFVKIDYHQVVQIPNVLNYELKANFDIEFKGLEQVEIRDDFKRVLHGIYVSKVDRYDEEHVRFAIDLRVVEEDVTVKELIGKRDLVKVLSSMGFQLCKKQDYAVVIEKDEIPRLENEYAWLQCVQELFQEEFVVNYIGVEFIVFKEEEKVYQSEDDCDDGYVHKRWDHTDN